MKKIFDHLFYRVYWWNKSILKEKDFVILSTLLGFSVLHVLNISTIIFVYLVYVLEDTLAYSKMFHVFLMFTISVIDYFIYIHSKRYISIIHLSQKKNIRKLRILDALVFTYVVFTFGLFIWIIIKGRELAVY